MKAYGNIAPLNVQVIRDFKGMDNRNQFTMPDNVSTWLHNCTTEFYPEIRVRNGISTVGYATISGSYGNGITTWKNSELNVIMSGTWKKYDGVSAWTTVTSGLSATAYCSFCNFQGNLAAINLLMANGVDAVKKYNGTTVSNLSGAPSGIAYIDAHDNRVYGATGNTIYFSALRKPEDWTTVDDAGSIVVESANGETIKGIRAGLQHLIVFKSNSMYELFGTGPANFRLIQVSDEIGIVNHRCSVTLNGVVYFLHSKGFYRYTGGSQPDKSFSQPIQQIIDNCYFGDEYNAVGTDGKFIYVSLYCPSYTSESTYNNLLLQYNVEQGLWSNYYAYSTSLSDFEVMDGVIYGTSGSNGGRVLKLNNGGTSDTFSGTSTVVTASMITKPFNYQLLAQKSRYVRLFISYVSSTSNSITIYYKSAIDNSRTSGWTSLTTVSDTTGQLVTARIVLPNSSIQENKYLKLRFDMVGNTRIIDYAFELLGKPLV